MSAPAFPQDFEANLRDYFMAGNDIRHNAICCAAYLINKAYLFISY
jgi:hypothetical protein